jgi:hypothetical protein
MWNIILLTGLFLAGALVYHFRKPILERLRRFDARNAARRSEEIYERRDRFAHYRRAVLTAEESLEEVREVAVPDPRTGQSLTRFLFLGDYFLTREDALRARRVRAIEIAREFYAELDGATIARRPPHEPDPSAALPSPNDKVRPPPPS